MSLTQSYAHQIQEAYPELRINTIRLNEDGQYNHVLIVNEALVFRFAKYETSVKTLQREVTILRHLQGHLSLDIPQPRYQQLEKPFVGEAFMGYPLIQGIPLWDEFFQTIQDKAVLNRMAHQLGTFLRELHQRPAQDLIPLDLAGSDTRAEWLDVYTRIQAKLFPLIRPDAREQVTSRFETYLDTPRIHHFTPVLRHGDFGGGNIIFNPETQSIAGVIDFAFTGLGDPAVDIAGLQCFGDTFFEASCQVYPEMAAYEERSQFYRSGAFALLEALFGVEQGDQAALEGGLASYV
jgi:aminoglycoside 2''-phosphotransferase